MNLDHVFKKNKNGFGKKAKAPQLFRMAYYAAAADVKNRSSYRKCGMHIIFVQSAEVILRYVLMRESAEWQMREPFRNQTEIWSEKIHWGLKDMKKNWQRKD